MAPDRILPLFPVKGDPMRKVVLALMTASVLVSSGAAQAQDAQHPPVSSEVAAPAPQSTDYQTLSALHAPADTPEATAGMTEYEAYLTAWAVGTLVYILLLNSY